MIKKGFNMFKAHPPFLYSRGCDIELFPPQCCQLCKGCLFNIGRAGLCRYRKAFYDEMKVEEIRRYLKLKGNEDVRF